LNIYEILRINEDKHNEEKETADDVWYFQPNCSTTDAKTKHKDTNV